MPHTIFIIDDNHEIIKLTKSCLRHFDMCKVYSFATPQAALHKMEAFGIPDLIITDLRMPSMNGIEFIARVSALQSDVPFIIFTGHPEVLPPRCNCSVVFKDAHGFERLVEEVRRILDINKNVAQEA